MEAYFFSYLEPPVEEMESNDKEAVDDGFESYEDSEDFEDAGQVILAFCLENCPDLLWEKNVQFIKKKLLESSG